MSIVKEQKTNHKYIITKRIFDIVFSGIALLSLLPLLLIIAILIKVQSPGPVFFRQERVGINGRRFHFLKFRTMKYINDSEEEMLSYLSTILEANQNEKTQKGIINIAEDPRITRIGRFLRRTALDEFPQFLNVLKGDMSMVGPRPAIPYEVDLYDEWHKERLKTKPGIIGLWHVSPHHQNTFDEMVKLDIQYLRNPSILADLRILFKAFNAVLKDDVLV